MIGMVITGISSALGLITIFMCWLMIELTSTNKLDSILKQEKLPKYVMAIFYWFTVLIAAAIIGIIILIFEMIVRC